MPRIKLEIVFCPESLGSSRGNTRLNSLNKCYALLLREAVDYTPQPYDAVANQQGCYSLQLFFEFDSASHPLKTKQAIENLYEEKIKGVFEYRFNCNVETFTITQKIGTLRTIQEIETYSTIQDFTTLRIGRE
jgi:hypothetical protein